MCLEKIQEHKKVQEDIQKEKIVKLTQKDEKSSKAINDLLKAKKKEIEQRKAELEADRMAKKLRVENERKDVAKEKAREAKEYDEKRKKELERKE